MNKKGAAVGAAVLILALQACGGGGGGDGGGGGGGGNGGTPTPAPVPQPTVSLDTSSAAARVGDKVTLTWNAQNATACTASGSWIGSRGVSGSEAVDLTSAGTTSFTLTCTGAGGNGAVTRSVTTAPKMTQLSIPGAPAPVAVAKGSCVATSDADFEVRCINAAGSVPTKYDIFDSTLSGRVIATASSPAQFIDGGACTAGFDRLQSRLSIDTTIADQVFPITGSSVSEIVYKPAFLATITGGIISQMSVLFFQDDSNTDRAGYVMYAVVSGEEVLYAGGGTVKNDGAFDIVSCIGGEDDPTPPPPPPPANLSCPAAFGAGTNGLELYGTTSYNITNAAANATSARSMGWGVRYNDPNRTSDSYTGSLRIQLWATTSSYGGGTINGYTLFTGQPNFGGAGAKSSNQIYNFYTFPGIASSGTGRNPPAGKYCLTATLEQFSSSCTSDDGYCIVDWIQFDGAEQFSN